MSVPRAYPRAWRRWLPSVFVASFALHSLAPEQSFALGPPTVLTDAFPMADDTHRLAFDQPRDPFSGVSLRSPRWTFCAIGKGRVEG